MRTLGLLGGMSWESTTLYYQLINRCVRNRLGGLSSAPCIIHSFDFAIIEHLQSAGDWDSLSQLLAEAASGLKAAGALGIVICTNTMHKVADSIEERVQLPILHIADMTGQAIVRSGHRKIGLLGTRYTMLEDFYKKRMEDKFSLRVIVPNMQDCEAVHAVIYEELCNGMIKAESKAVYIEIVNKLIHAGAECVVFGCTEIGLLLSKADVSVPVFDTTVIHAEGAADWAMARV